MISSKDILVLGCGFIGSRIKEALGCEASEERWIGSFDDAQYYVDKYKPKVIINCIGFTGRPNVDNCEKNLDKTLFNNSFVPLMLAEVAYRNKIKFVHLSSGCIYHGTEGYSITEEQQPDFLDLYYSRTKIYSDVALEVLSRQFDVFVLRIRIPLDDRPHSRNILTKLISYKKVIDVPNSVTYIPDFLKALEFLINENYTGVFNVVNPGELRYPDLLKIYQQYNPSFDFEVIDLASLPTPRTNLILSSNRLSDCGFEMRPIKSILNECVNEYSKKEKVQ